MLPTTEVVTREVNLHYYYIVFHGNEIISSLIILGYDYSTEGSLTVASRPFRSAP